MAHVRHHDFLSGVIDFVNYAVAAHADSVGIAVLEFLAAGRPWILCKQEDGRISTVKVTRRKGFQFLLGSRQDEDGIIHFRERLICYRASA